MLQYLIISNENQAILLVWTSTKVRCFYLVNYSLNSMHYAKLVVLIKP